MPHSTLPLPADLRDAASDAPKTRARDLADRLGIAEAQLVAAHTGHGVTRISAAPERLIPMVTDLGEVMALTRTGDCVHEKIGTYTDFHPGPHAAMTLGDEIDLRIFPAHWVHAFAQELPGAEGPRRSLQIFDAAGDAVHKIHLRPGSDTAAWARILDTLALPAQSDTLTVAPRQPAEPPRIRPENAQILRRDWARLTDTHQFLRLCARLKMNRLGANRLVGAPFARPLAPSAVDSALQTLAATGTEVMIFVGNRGCIQIHTGPIETLRPTGPWQNVMDPRFNLHLRRDRVAEVWAVEKPTRRGPALSVEAFDAEGGLICQIFGVGKPGRDQRAAWARIVADLPSLAEMPA